MPHCEHPALLQWTVFLGRKRSECLYPMSLVSEIPSHNGISPRKRKKFLLASHWRIGREGHQPQQRVKGEDSVNNNPCWLWPVCGFSCCPEFSNPTKRHLSPFLLWASFSSAAGFIWSTALCADEAGQTGCTHLLSAAWWGLFTVMGRPASALNAVSMHSALRHYSLSTWWD